MSLSTLPTNGCYGCVDIPDAFGFAIRHFTHSKFSHAFVVIDANAGTILEAQPKGSRIGNLSEYYGLPMVFSSDAVAGGNLGRLTKLAPSYVGIPYGFLDIFYLGLALGPGWRPGWLLEAVEDTHTMICSQLVAAFGVRCGANSWMCGQPDAQLVTPGMLAARAMQQVD